MFTPKAEELNFSASLIIMYIHYLYLKFYITCMIHYSANGGTLYSYRDTLKFLFTPLKNL